MECIEDVRSLLQGVIFAQSSGAYSLENSEQIAPIVRRILNKYPDLQGQSPNQVASRPQQPSQKQMTTQVWQLCVISGSLYSIQIYIPQGKRANHASRLNHAHQVFD